MPYGTISTLRFDAEPQRRRATQRRDLTQRRKDAKDLGGWHAPHAHHVQQAADSHERSIGAEGDASSGDKLKLCEQFTRFNVPDENALRASTRQELVIVRKGKRKKKITSLCNHRMAEI